MKIYFTTSFRSKSLIQDSISKVVSYSRQVGHHINDIEPMSESESASQGKSLELHNRVVKLIKNADIVISEMSTPSSGVGFEVALAVMEKKPTLVLVRNESKTNLSDLIKNAKSKYLTVKNYSSNADLEVALKYFFKDALEKIDTKFILIIPPMIDRYLEWNVKEKGLSKAEVTREAVEKMMADDKRYQAYLKESGLAD